MHVCDQNDIETPAARFGEALRSHRQKAGLTQEELAERAGVSPRSISGLERGEGATPRRDTLALLVRALALSGHARDAFEAMIVRQRRLPRRLTTQPQSQASTPHLPRHNLGRSLTSFLGREREQDELAPMLIGAPLVTLIGAGGIGKTRLAQELVRKLAGGFADGACFVELAAVSDPNQVPRIIAAAVGVRGAHASSFIEMLVEHLRSKRMLLVLDNCEHLVDACAAVLRDLLAACLGVHALVTSRTPLGIDAEIVRHLAPLELPDVHAGTTAAGIATSAAVRLFVERARAVNLTFSVTDANAAAVAQVCIAVDGLPLALELAAARTRVLTVAEVQQRVVHDFRMLRDNRRDAPARHQSMRATIDWSHDRLDDEERTLLHSLSAFACGWTLEMAEAAGHAAGINRSSVLDVLGQLVDKSLVVVDVRGAEARYRLLEPIRQRARAS